MAGDPKRFRNPASPPGLVGSVVALGASLASALECRIALFAHESKGGLTQIVLMVGALVAALLLLGLAWVFLVVAAIFGIAYATNISWLWIALLAALLNILLAIGCGFFARLQMSKPIFPASLAELQRDREWLKSTKQENR